MCACLNMDELDFFVFFFICLVYFVCMLCCVVLLMMKIGSLRQLIRIEITLVHFMAYFVDCLVVRIHNQILRLKVKKKTITHKILLEKISNFSNSKIKWKRQTTNSLANLLMTPDDSTGPSVGPDGNCTGPIRSKSKWKHEKKQTNKYHRF